MSSDETWMEWLGSLSTTIFGESKSTQQVIREQQRHFEKSIRDLDGLIVRSKNAELKYVTEAKKVWSI